jgi:outer membrane lipoprotein
MRRTLLLLLLATALASCAHAVSREAREAADTKVDMEDLFAQPSAYEGRTVLIGGFLINATAADVSELEVLEAPLDWRGRPGDSDRSRGRFIVRHQDHLDPAIYSPGRPVALAGTVTGVKERPLDGATRRYPVIQSRELKLLKPRSDVQFHFGLGVFHGF